MSLQTIDIGIQGNDGTGDSIRDSFRKVNENFNELYAVFGVDGTIKLKDLGDGTTYTANQIIMGNTTGSALSARTLIQGSGIQITTTNNSSVTIASTNSGLIGDDSPTLKAPMNSNGLPIGRVPDPTEELVTAFNRTYAASNITTTIDQLAINKGYADRTYIKIGTDGKVSKALKVRSEPVSPELSDSDYDSTLTGNYLSTEALPRKDVVYRGGDTMTGPLILSDHPAPLEGFGTPNGTSDLQSATKFYVDNNTFTSAVNLYVSTSTGDDLQQKTPLGKEGRFWQYAYKTIGAAALAAENLQSVASSEPGPYRQRIGYTIGPDLTFSTVQAPSGAGYVVNGALLKNGNSGNTGYTDAFELLRANKAFIQAETIAYINRKYVNAFTYDKLKCQRDVQLILDAVGYDLVLGTNFNTTRAATSYYDLASSKVISAQLIQTIDAMKFVRDQILGFSYDSAATEAYVQKVVESLCYDLLFQSNFQSVQTAINFAYAGTNVSSDQMVDVLKNLQNDLLGVNAITTITSAQKITSIAGNAGENFILVGTNVGLIVGMPVIGAGITPGTVIASITGTKIYLSTVNATGVSGDGIFGSNVIIVGSASGIVVGQSVAGQGISTGSSVTSINGAFVFLSQLTSGTVDGKGTFSTATAISGLSAASTSVVDNISEMILIIQGGDLPSLRMPSVAGADEGYGSARDLLLTNISFLQAEAIAYLGAQYPNLAYDRTLCKRDVKYITWSLIYDLMYFGNSQSVFAGKMYWDGLSRRIADTEVTPFNDVLTYLNGLMRDIVTNTTAPVTYQTSIRQYSNETYINGTIAIASIDQNVGYILDIINDQGTAPSVVHPTTTRGLSALQTVRTSTLSHIDTFKSNAVNYVTTHFPVINDLGALATISDLFQIVIDVLTFGISVRQIPYYTTPSTSSTGYTSARELLLGNLDYIKDETIGWLQINESAVYAAIDTDTCKRDIGYIIEAVCYDITYGTNSASVFAGLQYWINSTRQIASTEVNATVRAINFIGDLAALVIKNQGPLVPYSSTPRFEDLLLVGGIDASSAVGSAINTVKLIVGDNTLAPTVVPPTLGAAYSSNYKAFRNIIVANTSSISLKTTNYLDVAYKGGFNYNETICHRDVGYIIDAMAIDIVTGGTYQSIFAGKSYYRNTSARSIAIGSQLNETIDGINFAKELALQVLNQTEASRFQTLEQQHVDPLKTASSGAISALTYNMGLVVNIIRNGLGAAPVPSFGTGIWEMLLNNGSVGHVDQGAPGNVDIIPAKVLVGISSNAYSSIVKYVPGSGPGVDTIQFRLTKPGFYTVGEQIEFGETVKDLHITIFVESGIYYEDYPLRLPTNCSIKGDEFRRTIIRPLDRISQSPWRKIFFYRDAIIDALEIGPYNYTEDYATASSITLSGTSSKITVTLNTGVVPQSWIGKVLMDNYQVTPGNYSKRGRAIIDSVSNNVMNCSVIYPFHVSGTIASGNWKLYGTINYGRHYLEDPLDVNSPAKNNKYIDVFLCNDQTRISNLTFQRQGGFAMVLDPEGQIKTKSPYGQVCSSFSQSTNSKTFAGGQFVDGFTGRLFGTITNIADNGITITVQGSANSGLDIRPPQPPCAFFVQGSRYQVNDVVSYNSATSTVVLTLDVGTPYWPAGPALISGTIVNASSYNNATCSRDVGLILDAVTWDLVTGSNFQAVRAGVAYARADASIVITGQLQQTVAGINKARDLALAEISGSTYAASRTSINNSIRILDTIITQGIGAAPAVTFPTGPNSTANAVKLKDNLQANRSFVQQEIVSWIAKNYIVKNIPNYNSATCARDVGYMVDSICYDIMYGGNSMTFDAVLSYYGKSLVGETGSNQIAGEESVTTAAYGRLKTILQQIAKNTPVSITEGNTVDQTIVSGYAIADSTAEYGYIGDLCDFIIDYVADGDDDSPTTTRTSPTIVSLNATLLAARAAIESAKSTIQSSVITYLNNGGGLGINIEMGGNKSMLANDFAMINDLGYAVIAKNGGVTEQVSTFTYYCHTHYWAADGGQIRSVAGSNAHGDYGLRATGFDVTEKPDAVTLAKDMVQTAKVYKQGIFAAEMTPTSSKQSLSVFISGWDYIPYNISELEIDHGLAGKGIVRYEISTIEHTTVTINNKNVLKLNLSTAGNSGTSSTGLATALYDGQSVIIRNLQNMKFNNVDNVKPTRPSTALQYIDDLASIYRIIVYNLSDSTGELLGNNIAILGADNTFAYYKFVIDITNMKNVDPDVAITITNVTHTGTHVTISFADQGSAPYTIGQTIAVSGITPSTYNGIWTVTNCDATSVEFASTLTSAVTVYGVVGSKSQGGMVGDYKIAVLQISVQTTIDQINKGKFLTGWAGRTHRVSSYTTPLTQATASYVSGGYSDTTMYINAVAGAIRLGDIITSPAFTSGQTVANITTTDNVTYTVTLSAQADTQPSGTIYFGINRNGWLNINTAPVENLVGDGTGISALAWKSTAALGDSTTAKAVTFDINYNPATPPIVDSMYYISGQSTTAYNGWHQAIGYVSKTKITVTDTTGLAVGMLVTGDNTTTIQPSTIIQSIDSGTEFTVSPAAWIPSGALVSSTIIATVDHITITDGGGPTIDFAGYTYAPQIIIGRLDDGGATVQAIATCKILNGSIDSITLVSPGYGYTSVPSVEVSYGNATLTAVLTSSATIDTAASAGESTNTVTFAYTTNPGSFITDAPITASANPSTTGTGPFAVSFTIDPTSVVQNAYYKVAGNDNPLFNGLFKCTTASGSVTTITLEYAHNPGTFGTGTTTLTKELTTATTNALGISKPFPVDTAATLRLGYPGGTAAQVTTRISTCRATGHDFLDIGTGSYSTTNYPYQIYGNPTKPATQSQEVYEEGVGRVFYVSTDQNGIFRVGRYFTVDQGTGTVTFSASIALSNLDGLGFKRGVVVSEFSTDSSMTNNATDTVSTQSAIRSFVDRRLGLDYGGGTVAISNLIGPGYMALNGVLAMKAALNVGGYKIVNLATPELNTDAATKLYVDNVAAAQDQFSELHDVTFGSPSASQIPVFNGTSGKWNNASMTGDITIAWDGTTLTSTIGNNKIVNAMVSSTAAIAQSKLAMTAASTRASASGIAQADLGLASFDSANFTATNGWIGIKASSITKAQMSTIGNGSILANFSGSAANPREESAATVVSQGDGIKNASFFSTGAITSAAMVATYDGSNTSNNTYALLNVSSSREVNSIVKSLSDGAVDMSYLKVGGYKAIDLSSTTVQFWTPGNFNWMTATGSSGSNTTINTYGTLDTSNGTLKAATLTSGSAATTGAIIGTWQVGTSSSIDVTSGTLKTTTLTTGADGTAGTIQGTWSLTGSSKLQATYAADLAEFYEGDAEYEVGTVLVFGGDKEVTTTTDMNDTRVAGVVSDNAAYSMNGGCPGLKNQIALQGRVPCKVVGRVKKGDLLTTAATPGYAVKANDPKLGSIIGKALENKDYGEAGVIEVAVGRM